MSGKFSGTLDMNSLQVGGHLGMRRGVEFGEVSLALAKIQGGVVVDGAKFSGTLDMTKVFHSCGSDILSERVRGAE
jgi:hypothetical protein